MDKRKLLVFNSLWISV